MKEPKRLFPSGLTTDNMKFICWSLSFLGWAELLTYIHPTQTYVCLSASKKCLGKLLQLSYTIIICDVTNCSARRQSMGRRGRFLALSSSCVILSNSCCRFWYICVYALRFIDRGRQISAFCASLTLNFRALRESRAIAHTNTSFLTYIAVSLAAMFGEEFGDFGNHDSLL